MRGGRLARAGRALKLEREAGRHVERALVQLEAERLVRVGARELRVGGAARRRPRRLRAAPVALRLGRPRREHRRLDRHRLLLDTSNKRIFTSFTVSIVQYY